MLCYANKKCIFCPAQRSIAENSVDDVGVTPVQYIQPCITFYSLTFNSLRTGQSVFPSALDLIIFNRGPLCGISGYSSKSSQKVELLWSVCTLEDISHLQSSFFLPTIILKTNIYWALTVCCRVCSLGCSKPTIRITVALLL